MAVSLSNILKAPATISGNVYKDITNSCVIALGPGSTWQDIVNNAVASNMDDMIGPGQTGTFYWRLTSGNIVPNSDYKLVAVCLGGEASSILDGTLPPAALTSKSVSVSGNTATISFSVSADGGYYNKAVQYSLDNGSTWVTGDTITGGTAQSSSFDITSLSSGDYTALLRTSTPAGYSVSGALSFSIAGDSKLYGSVNGQSKQIKKLYGSVNGQTKQITKLYGSVNGRTKLIYKKDEQCQMQIIGDDICEVPDLEVFTNKFAAEYPNETVYDSSPFSVSKAWLEILGTGDYYYYYAVRGVDQLGEVQPHVLAGPSSYSDLTTRTNAWGITLKAAILDNAAKSASGKIVCS